MKNLKFLFVLAFTASTVLFSCKSGKKDGGDSAYIKNFDSLKTVLASFDADLVKIKDDMKKMNEEKMSCKPLKGKEKECDSLKKSCEDITMNLESSYKEYKEAVAMAETKAVELKVMKDKADKGDKEVSEEKAKAAYENAVADIAATIAKFNPKSDDSCFKTEMKNCENNCNACEGICEGEKGEGKEAKEGKETKEKKTEKKTK